MDVSKAQVTNLGDEVALAEYGWPFTVRVQLYPNAKRPEIRRLVIEERTGYPITGQVLAQLPMQQIAQVAASLLAGEGEAQYRMLARPRPKGVRSWPADHYERVNRVASWARATGRPGGAAGTVADFWGVHYRTARRWLAHPRSA